MTSETVHVCDIGPLRRLSRIVSVACAGLIALAPAQALAHSAQIPVAGQKVVLKVSGSNTNGRKLLFKAKDPSISTVTSPTEGFRLLVTGEGGGRTALVALDTSLWQASKNGTSYIYKDKLGSRGGVQKVVLKAGKITIKAKGPNLAWAGSTNLQTVWVLFRIEEEWHCAKMTGSSSGNGGGPYKAQAATAPGRCPEPLCGNASVEVGEECDDGDVDDADSCTHACVAGTCGGTVFETTFDAIQAMIFDNPAYGCTGGACHDSVNPEGDMDLTAKRSYESLLGLDGTGALATNALGAAVKRVEPSEPLESFLYHKLARSTLGDAATFDFIMGGSPMPVAAAPLSADHLEAIYEWIRGGAPRDRVVAGTAELLGTCLSEPQPLKVPPPAPPDAQAGLQLQQTPWPLPNNDENEICMATYFDVRHLVPEWAKIPCPSAFALRKACGDGANPPTVCNADADCAGSRCVAVKNATNPDNECFAWRRQVLVQDPQSHHSIVHIYTGAADQTAPGWGAWTYKFDDAADPRNGQPCDPAAVDPALGYNPGCSGAIVSVAGCLGYGPGDYSNFGTDPGALAGVGGGNSPQFSGSQEPYYDQTLADGVYTVLPTRGVVVWNSHAFNLTSFDTTLGQYLNLFYATREDQRHLAQLIFDARSIFVQDVPPFETREYCKTYTVPQKARLFQLSSHTHRHGTLFRIWAPPQTPCTPRCPDGFAGSVGCERSNRLPFCEDLPAPDPDRLIYRSTEYSDPLQLLFDQPIAHDSPRATDRTYLYCSVYDNGSTPESPTVHRQSMSPTPPLVFGALPAPGGPCADDEVACLGGDNKGELCGGDDTRCPGSVCDACPVRGGVTTEDEMFIMLGFYYVP